jgi:hypothetical protein
MKIFLRSGNSAFVREQEGIGGTWQYIRLASCDTLLLFGSKNGKPTVMGP